MTKFFIWFHVRRLDAIGIVLACLVLSARVVHAQRSIPDDNLAYPVLVEVALIPAVAFYTLLVFKYFANRY